MQTIADLEELMELIAPSQLAEEWDNVGLLVGERSHPLQRLLLCIDLRENVLAEAIGANVDAIVAYHPPIFQPLRKIDDSTTQGRILIGALASGIAIYSPHTAADAAPDGVNDWLASGLGQGQQYALRSKVIPRLEEEVKIVTFCPEEAVEGIRNELAAAGAGMIGDYALCSFEITGTGTFHGGAPTNPVVGTSGKLERVEEVRLEMVCGRVGLPRALEQLRKLHPYEEPPIEIHPLDPHVSRRQGAGRKKILETPATFTDLAENIRTHLATSRLIGHEPSPGRLHAQIGLCAGSGGDMLDDAMAKGCSLFVTGEMRHHDVLKAIDGDCAVILAGHTNTERGWLKVLRNRLKKALNRNGKKVEILQSSMDKDPLRSL